MYFVSRQDEFSIEEEKIAQKSDEALSDLLTGKRELLDAQECQSQELERIKQNVNSRKSKLALKVSQAEEKREKLENEIIRKQQSVLHLNDEYNSSVEILSQRVKNLEMKLNGNGDNDQPCDIIPTTFLGTLDKHMISKEDNELTTKINKFIDTKLQQTYSVASDGEMTPWKERTAQQHDNLVAEISRLKICHRDAERNTIIRSAEVSSAKAVKQELEEETKKLIQGKISLEKSVLQGTVADLESKVNKLQEELTNILKDKLPIYLEESTSKYCEAIFKADIEAKIKRQNLVISNMDTLIDVLLEQASYQEVLGLIIENEGNGLLELKETLCKIVESQVNESELEEKEKNNSEAIKNLKERRCKKILQSEDTFLLALHRILTNTEVEPNLITEDDVVHLVVQFVEEMNRLEGLVQQTESEWQRQKFQIEELIDRLQKELQIDSNNRCILTPIEVSNKIKLAENKVREFESAVKKKIQEWEELKREIKARPFLATQKKFSGSNIIETFGSIRK